MASYLNGVLAKIKGKVLVAIFMHTNQPGALAFSETHASG